MGISSGKNKPSVTDKGVKSKPCQVPETSVFFNFQYITSDKRYNYERLGGKGISKTAYKDIMNSLYKISQQSWIELSEAGKDNGGFETIEYGQMASCIINRVKDKPITKDTKLYVFRVGGNKYRMVGYKSPSCKAAMHILGFDFDFTLYDHGN